MYVGVGARRVRDIFKQARELSPCILFIDEIECLGMKRNQSMNYHAENLTTIDQLLTEMDGFNDQSRVVVLAATNKHTMLDEALMRPGRFDRKIAVELPSL